MKWFAIAPLIVMGVGCQSSLTGNEGNLTFSYTADDQVSDFNKPIGVGASLEIRVVEAGTRNPVTLNSVTSSDPATLKVVSTSGGAFVLRGLAAGEALIEVEADNDGDVVTDSVNMLAAVPEVLKLSHSCDAGGTLGVLYSSNSEILVPFDLERANGQAVIGYGLFPLEISGDASLDRESTDQANLHIHLGAAGSVEIASVIDGSRLSLDVIDDAAIDGAALTPLDGLQILMFEGETRFAHVSPMAGEKRVCQSTAVMTAVSTTPEICAASATPNLDDTDSLNESLWLKIEAKAFGTCQIDVTFPDGADGAGATSSLEVSVGMKP